MSTRGSECKPVPRISKHAGRPTDAEAMRMIRYIRRVRKELADRINVCRMTLIRNDSYTASTRATLRALARIEKREKPALRIRVTRECFLAEAARIRRMFGPNDDESRDYVAREERQATLYERAVKCLS